MKEIIIESKKWGTFHVKLDDEDYEWAKEHKWCVKKSYFCKRDKFYVIRARKKSDGPGSSNIYLHQQIAKTPKGMVTDHINGDPLDNRRENLRVLTHAENMQNQKSHADAGSKFIGVHRTKKSRKNPWIASLSIKEDSSPCGKKQVFNGYYPTEEEAAYARDLAVLKYRPLARLNFPQNKEEYLSIIENETKVD
tara:strand:- start:6 stop:587 length:582 start_codon:yes stop_codon:yes gene_type:complete